MVTKPRPAPTQDHLNKMTQINILRTAGRLTAERNEIRDRYRKNTINLIANEAVLAHIEQRPMELPDDILED